MAEKANPQDKTCDCKGWCIAKKDNPEKGIFQSITNIVYVFRTIKRIDLKIPRLKLRIERKYGNIEDQKKKLKVYMSSRESYLQYVHGIIYKLDSCRFVRERLEGTELGDKYLKIKQENSTLYDKDYFIKNELPNDVGERPIGIKV
ncbi:hypothetical protein G9C98_007474 [Cotesia typhae]|uniref:Uncharacterized protein n=1 Tax=Cotesia typhae TaxID=2053667 RepID=A0A8J5V6I5_9HYME|nr:hypothetical protein G9C98_007474 [Cotesia typhae]